MADSILNDVKKVLSLPADYTAFDQDIILHINSVFSTLNDLGIGPADGFAISDDSATWGDLIGTNARYNAVKTYVALRVRMIFDPPSTQYVIDAFKQQIQELEWRLNRIREETDWVDPTVPTDTVTLEELIFDGGTP